MTTTGAAPRANGVTAELDVLESPESSREESPPLSRLVFAADGLDDASRWIIKLRWLAVLAALTLTILGVQALHLLSHALWWPLVGTLGLLAATNIVYWLLGRRADVAWLVPLQIYVDLLIFTVLLHFSGGIENPLSLLSLFQVVLAGTLLRSRQCYAVAGFATALFVGMALLEATHVLQHYTLGIVPHGTSGHAHAALDWLYVGSRCLLHGAVLFFVSYFVTTLAGRDRANRGALQALADQALAERRLLEQALDTTDTGLRVVDAEGNTDWVSKRWRDWFSANGPALGSSTGVASAASSRAQVTERAIPAGDSDPSLWRSGAQRVFRVTTAPIRGPDKRIHKIAELAQDISKDKIAQEKMVRAGRLAAVGELAGQIAHEVNNPIAIISAKARLLLSIHREQLSSKTIAELEKIVHQSDRVAGIAQGLLSYCRPSAGARAPVDVRAPLRSALSLVEQRARGLKVSLKDSLESTSVSVVANAGELEQVFLNLLLNAIDAMPDGGELSTTLTAAKDEDGAPWLQIDIADTGHGIDPDALEHIWDPFFTTKPAGRGTGLGLSICAGLIRSHNGHIDVRENSPVGTIMTVHLPVSELTANA